MVRTFIFAAVVFVLFTGIRCGSVNVANLDPSDFSGANQTAAKCEGVSNSFVNDVVPIFTEKTCADASCHGAGSAGGMTLTGTNDEIFDAVTSRVSTSDPASSLILRKGTGGLSHGGGQPITSVDDPAYVTIFCWISAGAENTTETTPITTPTPVAIEATLASIQTNLFTPSCATSSCHSSANQAGGLSLADGESFGELVGVDAQIAPTKKRVFAGNPTTSFIIQKLEDGQAGNEGDRMPPGSAIGQATIDVVRQWIQDGAANN